MEKGLFNPDTAPRYIVYMVMFAMCLAALAAPFAVMAVFTALVG